MEDKLQFMTDRAINLSYDIQNGIRPQSDNWHSNNQLVYAAMCYACPAQEKPSGPTAFFRSKEKPAMWPWDKEEWKPSHDNRIRELTRSITEYRPL